MAEETTQLLSPELTERRGYRREEDLFFDKLHDHMRSKNTILESLDVALTALEAREYVSPRVYRKKGNEFILLRWRGLPDQFARGRTSFSVKHPILEEILNRNDIYQNNNIFADPNLITGPEDPMYYIRAPAMLGMPYTGISEIYHKEIIGAIIVNYFPDKMVDASEMRVLHRIAQLVGDQVTRLLELNAYREKQEELAKSNRQLSQQVKLDGPTGLFNKKTFHQNLEGHLAKAKESEGQLFLMLVDLDRFKVLNDIYGHAEGDRIIQEIGIFLSELKSTVAYRIGGEEFALVANLPFSEMFSLARQVQTGFGRIAVPPDYPPLTASIGITSTGENFRNGEEWYKQTDKMLYLAKGHPNHFFRKMIGGGNRTVAYFQNKYYIDPDSNLKNKIFCRYLNTLKIDHSKNL